MHTATFPLFARTDGRLWLMVSRLHVVRRLDVFRLVQRLVHFVSEAAECKTGAAHVCELLMVC